MKNFPLILSLTLLFTTFQSFSQEVKLEDNPSQRQETRVRIYESNESMSQGIQNALVLQLETGDDKLVESVWKDFLKDYGGKTKKSKGGKNEYLSAGTEIVGINGVRPINIYSKAQPGPDGTTEFSVWFDLGEGYLESNQGEKYKEAEGLLLKFAHEVKVENTRNELKNTEKELKRMESDLKQLERQNDNYHKDIENYERKIEEAKENIKTNQEQQEDSKKKIELQKLLVEEIDRRLQELRKQ